MEQTKYLLEMTDIEKQFPGVKALDHARLLLRPGTVHALMGENGAGKSTLMKCLFGIYKKDAGTIKIEGKEVTYTDPKDALDHGVAMVHQELNQVLRRNVMENVWLGRFPMKYGFVDHKKMYEETLKVFKELEITVNPKEIIGNLSVSQRQMVEIAKAVSYNAKILVLDEPTSSLTENEVEHLFRIIEKLTARGVGIIYISHKMDEINRISDRVTVMRDGEYVGTVYTKDVTKDDIVKMMVGRVIMGEQKPASTVPADAPVVLDVQHLNAGKEVKDVSFQLRKGEILGFAGLMGAGRTEVARALYGADPRQTGEIFIKGKKVSIKTPEQAVKNGICYLSEDRKRFGLMLDKSVTQNSAIASIDDYISFGLINDSKMREVSAETNAKLRTKTPSMEQLLKNLSGGNQQKVIIARWLMKNCDIFIFDEPTRGIDVGAKSEIYTLMEDLTKQGKSIIMISSELPEVLRMSDRIIVMCEGRKTGELDISEAGQENIMQLATMREEN